jgi:uncharacterized protein (DUF1697 family)
MATVRAVPRRARPKTWIALLRGINVVGRRQLLMEDLAAIFRRAGFTAVRTYIQSGNVVFESAHGGARALAAEIGALTAKRAGFEPQVMVLSRRELAAAVRGNPFPEADRDHKSLHLFFLSARPRHPDLDSLTQLKRGREGFALEGKVFYLFTPHGFPQCELHDKVERFLGVHASARNWRTANALLSMSAGGGAVSRVAGETGLSAGRSAGRDSARRGHASRGR